MKTRLACTLLLATALTGGVWANDYEPTFAEEYRLIQERLSPQPRVARGMYRDQVEKLLGAPSLELTPAIWVYYNFTQHAQAGSRLDTLVVTFAGHRVNELRLADRKTVDQQIAQWPVRDTRKAVATK